MGCWAADPGVRDWMARHGLSGDDEGAYLALQVEGGGKRGRRGGCKYQPMLNQSKPKRAGVCGKAVQGALGEGKWMCLAPDIFCDEDQPGAAGGPGGLCGCS